MWVCRDVGSHNDCPPGSADSAARVEELGKEAALALFQDSELDTDCLGRHHLVAVTVALDREG